MKHSARKSNNYQVKITVPWPNCLLEWQSEKSSFIYEWCRWTEITKPDVAFHNAANAPKDDTAPT